MAYDPNNLLGDQPHEANVIPTYRRTDEMPWPGTPPSPVQVDAATPVVGSLNPASAQIGSANFTMHVIGEKFRDGSTIIWNGSAEPTTFVSETELTTEVNMATATTPGALPICVEDPSGIRSNEVEFVFTPAA